jgi:sensor histidine kinase YesM
MAFFAEEKFSLQRQHFIRNLSVLALTGSILAPLAIAIRMGLLFLATLFRMSGSVRESTGAGFFPELGAQLFLYALAIAGAFVTRTFVQKSERDRERDRLALEKSQLEASLRQAELETLRMRLNPHFLFNTLQNISVLAEHDPSSASQMLSRLGDLLRASFRSDFQAEVPLETELGLTQAYLDVESIRFGDRLSVSMDVSDRTRQALVPALLLQPLVENAIIHGLRAQNAGRIRIRSAIDGDRLMLTVSDNGVGSKRRADREVKGWSRAGLDS